MIAQSTYRLSAWEEAIGTLYSVEEPQDGCLTALVGKVNLIIPEEMAASLQELQGQRIGILRTDTDYRVRVIAASKPATVSEPLDIAQAAL